MNKTLVGELPPEGWVEERDLEYVCQHLAAEFAGMAASRLLITGGAGFLGYYMVQAPVFWNRRHGDSERIDVTVLDNFKRGKPEWLNRLASAGEIELVEHDMRCPLPNTFGPFDFIVHAAGIASPIVYRKFPLETMDANIDGLRSLLDFCVSQARGGGAVKAFLFYSSSEIYGDPDPSMIPTPETYRGNVSCTGPRACYDESKRYGETLCVTFQRQENIPTKIARPFNNYGPGLKIDDGRVIPDFARCILDGKDIVMHSDGSPTRTFCYAADAVAGYYKVLANGRAGEPYNVGIESPEISMADLAELAVELGRELFQYEGRVRWAPSSDKEYLIDNPNRRCPDISKARSEIGYAPSIDIREGLRRSLIWYAHNR